MKRITLEGEDFFIDNFNNKWRIQFYTEAEANAWSHTMKNCHDCIDTVLCENCHNLEDSSRCKKCKNSTKLISCENCENIDNCSFCSNLTKGTNLNDVHGQWKFNPKKTF